MNASRYLLGICCVSNLALLVFIAFRESFAATTVTTHWDSPLFTTTCDRHFLCVAKLLQTTVVWATHSSRPPNYSPIVEFVFKNIASRRKREARRPFANFFILDLLHHSASSRRLTSKTQRALDLLIEARKGASPPWVRFSFTLTLQVESKSRPAAIRAFNPHQPSSPVLIA